MSFDELLGCINRRIGAYLDNPDYATIVTEQAALYEAMDLFHTAQDDEQREMAWYALGWLHCLRYTALPDDDGLTDLAKAVYFCHVMTDFPEMIPEPLHCLLGPDARSDARADLAVDLLDHALTTDDVLPIDVAVWLQRCVVTATAEGDPDLPVHLCTLGRAFHRRYEHSGEPEYLDEAIEAGERAAALMAPDDPRRAGELAFLGTSYRWRYERSGLAVDLDRAVDVLERAVASEPENVADRTVFTANLGSTYHVLFGRTGMLEHLDRAVALYEQAAVTADAMDRAAVLSNLGYALLDRHRHTANPDDLDRALAVGQDAVSASSPGTSRRVFALTNLSGAYRLGYERTGSTADLDTAIRAAKAAFDATPAIPASRPLALANVISAYRDKLDACGRGVGRRTLGQLVRQVERVAADATAAPAELVRLHQEAGALAVTMGELTTAVRLLDTAVALLPSVVPRHGVWADQEHRMGDHIALMPEAIAAHCAGGNPERALSVAESGRGVLLNARLDARGEVTDLDVAHPLLATRFHELRALLGTSQDETERHRLWAEYDDLVARIRRHAGFSRFLLPPDLDVLCSASGDGAVVLVNVARHRGDAVVVTSRTGPLLVPLPDLAIDDAAARADVMPGARPMDADDETHQLRAVLPETLGWLWDAVVGPVLARLADMAPYPSRIWWLPVGLMGVFPLHAAGRPGHPGALDLVTSSYIPTLRALAQARARRAAVLRRQLIVTAENVPGLDRLPAAAAEVAALRARHPDALALADADATTERVLAALPDATWTHFACHAGADTTAPSRSGLALVDGPLEVPRIGGLRLETAELAYLSACSTAQRSLRFSDESIHLASAFQLAGFRHVVASLWPLGDAPAALAADLFYDHLADNVDDAAAALRSATLDLRAEHPDRPDCWAPLVHSGP